ncbi:MAG: transcriptional regulator [Rhodoglobus sp.]|nr:transcriptional regulator [Rhodoglobus sp.]
MHQGSQDEDPVAAIEQAVIALRHSRHGPGHRGAPPWMQGPPMHHRDGSAETEHMPMMRGHRGQHDRSFGGAARFRLLGALRARGGMSVSEIAEMIGVDQPRASRLVNESAEHGLVTRRADERDARRSVVDLTEAGRAMLDTANATRRSAVTRAIEGFTPEETATFADLLTRFVNNWQR